MNATEHSTHSRFAVAPARWKPILTSASRAAAVSIIEETVSQFPNDVSLICNSPWPHGDTFDLANGCSGISLFLSHAATVLAKPSLSDRAVAYLNVCVDATFLDNTHLGSHAGLYTGFPGIAWTTEYVTRRLALGDHATSENDPIDDLILHFLAAEGVVRHFDLISGLAGLGMYGLECLHRSGARNWLSVVIRLLQSQACMSSGGITWKTPVELLFREDKIRYPLGNFNLGVAHGSPGVIAFLARAYQSGVEPEIASELIQGSVTWLLDQENMQSAPSRFRGVLEDDVLQCRLAWCYGDLGIAAAVYQAALAINNGAWKAEALRIARNAASRPRTHTGVADACFCHGTAGLAHIFNRFYQATGEAVFLDSAVLWFEETIRLRGDLRGPSQYRFRTMVDDQPCFVEKLGLLEGVAGIAACLAAAVSNDEPTWDRIFVTDIPSRTV